MKGALDGVRILDLTTVGFGPYATQLLGDYGADVVKVEPPAGDITRGIGPFRNPGMGHFFLGANRNKRNVVLDLKDARARDALMQVAADSDVVITSVRPAAMARLGLAYEDFVAVRPDIIYVALVGFGQDGPYAARPAYDDVIQGTSGMADMQGGRSGAPQMVKASICDKICSQFATHATLAALFHRERTGEGQFVEVPMLESMVGFNLVEHHAGGSFKPPLGPMGYDRTMAEHRRPYATKDGYVCVLPYNEKQWKAFFVLMGRDEMVDDIRINDAKIRSERIGELYEMVAELVADWTSDALLEALENADVPNGRSVPLAELAQDPHLAAVKLIEEVDHPSEGTIKMARPSVKMSKSPTSIRSLPESLGERSVEVLLEAGVPQSEIDTMLEAGITFDGRQQTREAAE